MKRHSEHWRLSAPSCPILPLGPAGQLEEPDFGLAGTQRPKGERAEDGLQTRGPEWACCRGRERGWPRPRWRGEGRGGAEGSSEVAVHNPSPVRILASPLGSGARPSIRFGPRSWGRPEEGRTEAQVPQGLSVQVGEMGRTPPDGSPAAKYRLSTPVLASSAPSTSVAKFLCSRRRSKRWRRPSMATAGPGLAARARPRRRAPARLHAHRLPLERVALLGSRASICLQAGPRPLPPAPANGRAGRAKEVGPAPSPPPHCPLAGGGRRSRDWKKGGGARWPRAPIGRAGARRS